jgi:hypothetical protein
MGAVTAALANGIITPGEAEGIARVITTFVRTIETSDFDRWLRIVEAEQAEELPGLPPTWPYPSVST